MNEYLDHDMKAETKRWNEIRKHSKYCKCGHTVIIMNTDKVLCSWCGNYVFKDDKTEFMYRMKENLKKNGNNL